MRTDMLQQSLEDLNGSTADIDASALIYTDGLMLASALPNSMACSSACWCRASAAT